MYETAQEFAEVGAGVGLWQRAWKILKKLGLEEDLSRVAFVPPLDTPSTCPSYVQFLLLTLPEVGFQFRKGNQREGVTFQQLMTSGMHILSRIILAGFRARAQVVSLASIARTSNASCCATYLDVAIFTPRSVLFRTLTARIGSRSNSTLKTAQRRRAISLLPRTDSSLLSEPACSKASLLVSRQRESERKRPKH